VVTRTNLGNLLSAQRVPWWTLVLPHLRDEGGSLMRHWLTPAGLDRVPDPGRWYAARVFGMTTPEQVAAAVRWLGADVRYVVDSGNQITRLVHIPATGYNRFMPHVQPLVQIGHDIARVGVKFPPDIVKRLELVNKLGHCGAELMHIYEDEIDYADESLWMDPPPPTAERRQRQAKGPGEQDEGLDGEVQQAERTHNVSPAEYAQIVEACRLVEVFGMRLMPDWFAAGGQHRNGYYSSGVPWGTVESSVHYFNPTAAVTHADPLAVDRLRALNYLVTRLMDTAPPMADTEHLDGLRRQTTSVIHQIERLQRPAATAEPPKPETYKDGEFISPMRERKQATENELRERQVDPAPDDPEAPTQSPQDFGQSTSAPVSDAPGTDAGAVDAPTDTEASIGFVPPGTTSD
jgi:hypothetical protein